RTGELVARGRARGDAVRGVLRHAGGIDALHVFVVVGAVAIVIPRQDGAARAVGRHDHVGLVVGSIAHDDTVGAPLRNAGRIDATCVDIIVDSVAEVVPRHDGAAGAVGDDLRSDLVVGRGAQRDAVREPHGHTVHIDALHVDVEIAGAAVLPGNDGAA